MSIDGPGVSWSHTMQDFVFAADRDIPTYIDPAVTAQLSTGEYDVTVTSSVGGGSIARTAADCVTVQCGDVTPPVDPTDPTAPEPASPDGPAIDEQAFTITIPDDRFSYAIGDTQLETGVNTLGAIGAGTITATPRDGVTIAPDAVLNRPDFCSYREPCPAGAGWADSRSA
ncbi:hypothetical protein [Microbacterium oleivorans]|uniref:Uncharacterized protein n=1 Tax=Microbacterium oleivorans TaxID=273677 RepID=A0A7D5IS30_9MICO|nr:hypothetical protein [Microbacterium oleivorans]QLD11217.1 hypothetical protein HW566_05155 [Microbacterium oleivorans]